MAGFERATEIEPGAIERQRNTRRQRRCQPGPADDLLDVQLPLAAPTRRLFGSAIEGRTQGDAAREFGRRVELRPRLVMLGAPVDRRAGEAERQWRRFGERPEAGVVQQQHAILKPDVFEPREIAQHRRRAAGIRGRIEAAQRPLPRSADLGIELQARDVDAIRRASAGDQTSEVDAKAQTPRGEQRLAGGIEQGDVAQVERRTQATPGQRHRADARRMADADRDELFELRAIARHRIDRDPEQYAEGCHEHDERCERSDQGRPPAATILLHGLKP